ncbi:MAG: ABC-type multidrug transport system, ATPase and permease component [Bacteroidetes bacterium]|jgi:ATP-binding cassette subfamily B protein|nr:ABC-type multidrug transport system, ATPase and permease component [Bacteroidota bacterium]
MRSLKYLNKYFLRYKVRLLLGFLFVAISNVLMIAQSDYIKKATDKFEKIVKGENTDKNELIMYAVYLLLLALGGGFFMFLKRQFLIVLSRLIEADLKNDIYTHYQQLDINFYKRNNTGDLMNRISEDVSRVRMYIGPAVMYIVDTFFTIATSLFFMLRQDAFLTMIVFIPLPLLSYVIFKVSDLINKKSTAVQENLSELTSQSQESFSGIRVIKAYSKENFFSSLFSKKVSKYREAALSMSRTEAAFHPFITLMIGLSLIAVVYFGGRQYIKGEILGIGIITQFIFLVYKLTWPFASLGWITSLVQRAAASQTRINEFLQTKPEIVNPTNEELKELGTVRFSNVSFTYPDTGIKALKNISFELKRGETVAITGPTGSGKSTVASLLTRMYDVGSGEISFAGAPVSKINLHALRRKTGYVPQEVFLFSDSIKNNIAFGLHAKGADPGDRVVQAAKDAEVHDNITGFPETYETVVGERGVTLSGGQKQRISIARAIIKDPELLIFDDCLSAVDTETEDRIVTNLKRIMQGKSSVIISHRISSIKHADRIIYLKNGEITEQGSHEELIALNGDYAELNRLQAL